MLTRSLLAVGFLAVTSGCVSSSVACDKRPEAREGALVSAPLPRGGWDGNGQSLGGWDANGQSLGGVKLSSVDVGAVGTKLYAEGGVELTVTAVEAGPEGAVFYRLEAAGKNVCGEGGKGLIVAGTWDATGARHDGGATFSCTTGAIAKCVLMGYAPADVGAELHQACTRMVRADYCGTGVSYTRDGTLIEPVDTKYVRSASGDAAFQFEAAWGTSGAVCVHRPRFDAFTESGDVALPPCWSALPRCESWGEAVEQGATLGVSSKLESRVYCD